MKELKLIDITKSFGSKRVLEGFSAVFRPGSVTSIMGPSGCGKTTLLNILMGLERADRGSVENRPARISAVFQEDRLCQDFSAVANVRMVTGRAVDDGEITAFLESLGLSGSTLVPVHQLSGGMKRRVAIARALLAPSELLVLDEPFKGLDEATREDVAAQVLRRAGGRTVVMVTHDPAEAKLMDAQVLEMRVLT